MNLSSCRARRVYKSFSGLAALIIFLSYTVSSSAQISKHLFLYFSNAVGDKELFLDTGVYKNSLNQTFTVSNFKYYISHIRLIDSDGRVFENNDGYYLIREDEPDSHHIELTDIPVGNYTRISFTIGVDSLHNCSGAQSGALDPINGMFWTWNSGYIFLKLEGKSPASKSPGHIFEYHIGGYKDPSNCIRNVNLPIGSRMSDDQEVYKPSFGSKQTKMNSITISADIGKLFSSSTIDLSKLSSVTDFHHASEIADNYARMFYVSHIISGY